MDHLAEWEKSCVDDQLTRLNVTPLQGSQPLDYLLYSDDLPRRNDGRVRESLLKRYEHTEQGGWWCSGIDLLTGETDLWGCFKPEQPRVNSDRGKPIKYEHPPKEPTGVFALRVPLEIWQRIAQRYQAAIDAQDLKPTLPDLGFWQWLSDHPSIPLCITEGAKKAGALLTAGYAAIALPGINSGYRVPRDPQGNRIGRSHLIPQLKKLVTAGREILIAFDRDAKPKTVKAVEAATKRLGYLLERAGCSVKVIVWNPQLGKGVDDLIANAGQQAFDRAYQEAPSLETWKAQALTRLTYTPNISLDCRYLRDLSVPSSAKLIGIKSPKGTGKTGCLETIVAQSLAQKQRVLVIGHRVRLVETLCQRFGLSYITDVEDSQETLGYGLCIDSLHPASQARFNADDWEGATVIIDEVEQVLWHGLNSDTCKGNRVAILKSLKTLMQNVLGSGGQVFVADADLSDTSLDYLISLAGVSIDPFIVHNHWQPGIDAWQVYAYTDSTPKKLIENLEQHIRAGGKPFVCLSAQKLSSQWGTCTLEAYLQNQFPQAKILRIDSESLADPAHPAYGCMERLNEALANTDIVLASPSIETGISIDLRGHFTSVWCIAQGVQTAHSVCQALSRLRENVPRYVWVAPYGFNRVGNGSTSIPALLTSGHRLTQLNIRLLQQTDFEAIDDLDTGFQAESLLCWAKMAVRVNALMNRYRESVFAVLTEEGHQVVDAPLESPATAAEADANPISATITAVQEQNYLAQCEAIAAAANLSDAQYQILKKQLVKSAPQRRALRKYNLKKRYAIPVTAKLVAQDDRGWYQKLRIHYFLTLGRPYLADRDAIVARILVEQGGGSLFLPDFNGSQLGATIGTMEVLGIPVLLQSPGRELKNTDPDLKAMAAIALAHRSEIKATVGIGLAKTASSITIIRRFLDLIDYGLDCLRSESAGKKRVRVYQAVRPNDGREQVFLQWLAADSRHPGSSEFWQAENLYALSQKKAASNGGDDYVQLSLLDAAAGERAG
ncbi:MAG: plasmid replication protein, CyRepA1 family [Cyanophyceae cyanobacterium]